MKHYSRAVSNRSVSQLEPLDETQVQNNAGGFVYSLNKWKTLERFLILGTEGGSYYVGENKLTKDASKNLLDCVKADGLKVIQMVVDISEAGRAHKNDPALFALAACLKKGDAVTRKAASEALPKVARIGTHLFHFADFVEAFGGWGRSTKRTVANWYLNKPVPRLAEQIVKYQARDGWSHSDLLRLSHVKTEDKVRNTIFRYAGAMYNAEKGAKGLKFNKEGLEIIAGFELAKKAENSKQLVKIITDYKLPRECVPTEYLNDANVWEALLPNLGLTAVIRNLGTMSKAGILEPLSKNTKFVINKLADESLIKAARVHPIAILLALKTYSSGKGFRGTNSWPVNQNIVDALDEAFYSSFSNVEPTGKNIMLALDVSGSMGGAVIANSNLTAREATAAMALVTARTEKNYHLMGFSNNFMELKISPKWRLEQVCSYMDGLPFDSTDCSLPMLYAARNRMSVDAFCIYTDNETYAGAMHPSVALAEYRKKFVKDARSIVVGTCASSFTIADPKDQYSLDVCGFDASVPAVISDFIR